MRKLFRRQGRIKIHPKLHPDHKSDECALSAHNLGDQEATTDFSDDYRSLPIETEMQRNFEFSENTLESPQSQQSFATKLCALKIVIDEQTEAQCDEQRDFSHEIESQKQNRDNDA